MEAASSSIGVLEGRESTRYLRMGPFDRSEGPASTIPREAPVCTFVLGTLPANSPLERLERGFVRFANLK